MDYYALAQLLAQLGGTAIGEANSAGSKEDEINYLKKAQQAYGGLDTNVNPAFQQQSQLSGYQDDPQLKTAEMAALAKLQQVGSSNGMMPQDQAKLQQALGMANANEAGQRGAALQSLAARGMMGGGQELAAQMASNQSGAMTGHAAGVQSASDASQRALQAIMGAGALGGTIRGQDFEEASRKAQAMDEINRFNAQMKYNAGNAQFQHQLEQAQGQAGGYDKLAQERASNAQHQRELWGGIGNAASSTAGAFGEYNNNNDNGSPYDVGNAADTSSYNHPYEQLKNKPKTNWDE